MTLYIHNVRRIRIAEEANGSFASDLSGSMGSFLDLPFHEGSAVLKLNQPTESPLHSQQHLDGYPLEVLMPKSAQLDWSMNLETLDTKPASGVTAAQGPLGLLLKVALGGENLGVGTAITTGATATSLPTSSAAGIPVGGCVGATVTSGVLAMREVKSKSSNTVTLKLALSGSPANSSDVKSAATYYMGGTDGSLTTSLQAAIEGLFTQDRYLLLGGWLSSITITLGPGAIPKVTFSFMFAQWLPADGSSTSGNLQTGALGIATYVNAKTIVQKDSELRQQTNATTTLNAATLLAASSIEFKPNLKYSAQRTPAGTNTIKQAIRDRSAPVIAGSFVLPYEDQTWVTARDSRTAKALWYQIGTSLTDGGILLAAPTVQVTNVQIENVDGILSTRVDWKGRNDGDTSGSTTDLAKSAFRIHLI